MSYGLEGLTGTQLETKLFLVGIMCILIIIKGIKLMFNEWRKNRNER
jgi:hypothetical protein